jgi:hypothetical protein
MRALKPPPRVIPQDNYTHSNDSSYSLKRPMEQPKLSNWQRAGYPSEYAYAKAMGLLEVEKNPPKVVQDHQPHNRASVQQSVDDDFEAAVQREMRLLEQRFQNVRSFSSPDVTKAELPLDDPRPLPMQMSKQTYNEQSHEPYPMPQAKQPYHQAAYDPPHAQPMQASSSIKPTKENLSTARRIGGGIKSLYGGEDDNKQAVKAAYAKLLAQQVEEQRAQRENNRRRQMENQVPFDQQPAFSSPARDSRQYQSQVSLPHQAYQEQYGSPARIAVAPADNWKPSGNYSDDRDKQKKAAMKAMLDQQREDDLRRKRELKEQEKREEMRTEQRLREAYEREEAERRQEVEAKKHAAAIQMHRERELQEEMRLQAEARRGRKYHQEPSHRHDGPSTAAAEHGQQYYDSAENGYHPPPPHQQQQDYLNMSSPRQQDYGMGTDSSPSKPARARLISDVYGSAGILSHDTQPQHNQAVEARWRPSGKQGDDKSKASRAELKAMLDQQRQDDLRRKEEEKRRQEDEERKMELKIRQAYEEEEMLKKQAEEQRRQQAIEIERRNAILQEEKRFEILAKKGQHAHPNHQHQQHRGRYDEEDDHHHHHQQPVAPAAASRSPRSPHHRTQTSSKLYPGKSMDSNYPQRQQPPPQQESHYVQQPASQYAKYPPQYAQPMHMQYAGDPRYRDPQPMPMTDYDYRGGYSSELMNNHHHHQHQLPPQRSSLSSFPMPMQPASYRDSQQDIYRQRPDSAAEVDAFLSQWQQQHGHSLASSLSSTTSSRSSFQQAQPPQANDMSFVGESRFVNASIASVGRILDAGAPPPAAAVRSRLLQQPYQEIDPEKSLDSESLFYYLGERPSILENSHGISNPIKRNLAAESAMRSSQQHLARAAAANSSTSKAHAPQDSFLSQLIDNTKHYIQHERKNSTSKIDGLSRALSSATSLTPRSSAALTSSAREVINPQKSPSG